MEHSTLTLHLPASEKFLHVVTGFAEESALAFGLAADQALALKLASEEIFCHVARSIRPDVLLEIRAALGSWYSRLDFIFPAEGIDLKAFNLTAALHLDDQEELDRMGLFLASRLVDHFEFDREPDQRLHLSVFKDKSYERYDKDGDRTVRAKPPYDLKSPDWYETIVLAQEIVNHVPDYWRPNFISYPVKAADMVKAGECQAAAAFGANGIMAGGLVWRWRGPRTVEFFGPYCFEAEPCAELNERLLENCINTLARSSCLSLMGRFSPGHLPAAYFQNLGGFKDLMADGQWRKRPTYFRLMYEDEGSVVWCHPVLKDELRKQYQRLELPRQIQVPPESRGDRSGFSVIASRIRRSENKVNLWPALPGSDIRDNLDGHLALFKRQGLPMIRFILDLGKAGHSTFVPHLLDAGFSPRLLLPYAGQGDQLIFQFGMND